MSASVTEGLSAGEALVGLLEAYGVDTVFGVPGVHNVEMYRALPRSKIRHILPRHEQGAGFMADGYARATGKPGVAFTITGPGLTNIMTPIGQAYSELGAAAGDLRLPRCQGRRPRARPAARDDQPVGRRSGRRPERCHSLHAG